MEDELDLGDRLKFSTDHQEQGRMDTMLKIKKVKFPHILIITHVNIRVGQVDIIIVIVAG